jgi:hypothetical protein
VPSSARRALLCAAPTWSERYTCGVAEARMFPEDPAAIARKLTELKSEHRDLDAAISRLALDVGCDELQLTRLKKRKLRLKDMIAYLENKLIPDLDA